MPVKDGGVTEQSPSRSPPKPDTPRITKGEDTQLKNAMADDPPIYKQIEYPVPWRALSAAVWRPVSAKARAEWRKRTRWGKLKLVVVAPLVPIMALGLASFLLIFAPGSVLIPFIDAKVRLSGRGLRMPATYKGGKDD